MYVSLELLTDMPSQYFQEPHGGAVLWRFLTLTKFEKLLKDSALWFCRSDLFSDQLEGSITASDLIDRKTRYRQALGVNPVSDENPTAEAALAFRAFAGKNARRAYYISCWHENEVESAAMWELYCPKQPGVAIKTTFENLKKSLQGPRPIPVEFSRVHYIDHTTDSVPSGNRAFPFIHKSKSLAHEQEVRAILNYLEMISDEDALNPSLVYPDGVNIAVDLPLLVNALYVKPSVEMSKVIALLSQYGRTLSTAATSTETKPIF